MESILSREFEFLKNDLIEAYDSKGMRASGRFAEELEVEATINKAILWGEDYANQLEFGRSPGRMSPVDKIEEWINHKGLASVITTSVNQFAWAIAKKHEREGWKREGFGGVELVSEIVTERRIQDIIDEVGESRALELTSEINELFNTLAA